MLGWQNHGRVISPLAAAERQGRGALPVDELGGAAPPKGVSWQPLGTYGKNYAAVVIELERPAMLVRVSGVVRANGSNSHALESVAPRHVCTPSAEADFSRRVSRVAQNATAKQWSLEYALVEPGSPMLPADAVPQDKVHKFDPKKSPAEMEPEEAE